MTDMQIEKVLAAAIACEDVDLVDLCETALKMIVQPNLKRAAIDRISELEGDTFQRTTKVIDDVIADTRAAIEQRAKRST